MSTLSISCDGTPGKAYGSQAVTTGAEVSIDLLVAAGAPGPQTVQAYFDTDMYCSDVAGGTGAVGTRAIVPGGSFKNLEVNGCQGAAIGANGGITRYYKAITANGNVTFEGTGRKTL